MKKGKFQDIRWKNPKTGLVQLLGEHIGNGVYANCPCELRNDYRELMLYNHGTLINENAETEIYLHEFRGKNLVVKRYLPDSRTNGIAQFRAMRKLREIGGLEVPDMHMASESALLMDHIPYRKIWEFYFSNPQLRKSWDSIMQYVASLIPDEQRDGTPSNGYLKPVNGKYLIGVFDQG